MVFAAPLALAATAVGAGITAYGKYQAGQAQAASYGYEADILGSVKAYVRNISAKTCSVFARSLLRL
jgi:hypothetical protein